LLSQRLLQVTSVVDEEGQPRVVRVHYLVQQLVLRDCPDEDRAAHQQAVDALIVERCAALEKTSDWAKARWELEPLTALSGLWDETNHPQAAWLLNQVGERWLEHDEWGQCEPMMRRALEADERSCSPDHPDVAIHLGNLASLLQATNRLAEAEPLFRRLLKIDERRLGPDHPMVAVRLNNLVELLRTANRLAEAESLCRRALAIWERSLGEDHPNVASALNNLALLVRATKRLDEAEPLMRRALEKVLKLTRASGHPHPHLQGVANNYARLLRAMGRSREQIQVTLREMAPEFF